MNSLLHQHRPYNFCNVKSLSLGTPLHVAAEGLLDTLQYLLRHGADPGVSPEEHLERGLLIGSRI
jgi:hypothetical protein